MQPQDDNLDYLNYITKPGGPNPAATPAGQPVAPQPQATAYPNQQAVPRAAPAPPQAPVRPATPQPQQAVAAPTPPSPKAEEGKRPNRAISSAQNSMLIAEIRDGIVIMRDGSVRAVVMSQSINFDLMSNQERDSVEYAYQGFLNSLYFPVQIVIRSLRVDLDSYMQKLEQTRNQQQNVLLQLLMEDYITYVNYLLESYNIMDKQFFVVVPYYPPAMSHAGITTGARKLTSLFKASDQPITINEVDFNRYRSELAQRVQVILGGLNRLGIQSVPLSTPELIELYYSFYNPVTAASQGLSNIQDLEATIITRGQSKKPGNSGGGS